MAGTPPDGQPQEAIKLHVYTGTNDGTESCDFRELINGKEYGEEQGDTHRTIAELDPKVPDAAHAELVQIVLTVGPKINRVLGKMVNSRIIRGILDVARAITGGQSDRKAGLRIGVWPGNGRT